MLTRLSVSDWLSDLECPRHAGSTLRLEDGKAYCPQCDTPIKIFEGDILNLVADEQLDEDALRERDEHERNLSAEETATWVLTERANLWKTYYSLDRQPGIKKLAEHLGNAPIERIYFLGAGTGREVEYLLQYCKFNEVICSDIAADNLRVISARLQPYNVKLGLFTSDLNYTPLQKTQIPVVIVNALHHTADMHRTLERLMQQDHAELLTVEPTGNALIQLLEKAGLARRVEYSGVKPGRMNLAHLRDLCSHYNYKLTVTTQWSYPQDYYYKLGINSERGMRAFLWCVRVFSAITAPLNIGNTSITHLQKQGTTHRYRNAS